VSALDRLATVVRTVRLAGLVLVLAVVVTGSWAVTRILAPPAPVAGQAIVPSGARTSALANRLDQRPVTGQACWRARVVPSGMVVWNDSQTDTTAPCSVSSPTCPTELTLYLANTDVTPPVVKLGIRGGDPRLFWRGYVCMRPSEFDRLVRSVVSSVVVNSPPH
jgi:hypothetical protein